MMAETRPQPPQRGALARLWRALKRAVLNKSDESYVAGLSGGEQYWDEAVGIYRPRPPAPRQPQ
jgi:hypothetical protein